MVTYNYTAIDKLDATSTFAYDINNNGQIVGGYFDTTTRGFIYTITSASFTAVLNDPVGINGTEAFGINDAGKVVGHFADGFLNRGFFYTNGAFSTSIVFPGAALDINNATQVVGDNGSSGFLYDNSVYTTIRYDGSTLTSAQGINDNGEVVGYYQDGTGYHGFTYTYQTNSYNAYPDVLLPGQTYLTGINDQGWVVGYYYDGSGVAHSFLDTNGILPGGFQTIGDDLDATGVFAQGINDEGQIVGYYNDSSGTHAFLASAEVPFTVSGRFEYRDKDYTEAGFTGTTDRPIRYATVEIYDQSDGLLGTTFTAADGTWSFVVPNNNDPSGRDIYVKVIADTAAGTVTNTSGVPYHYVGPTVGNWQGGNMWYDADPLACISHTN
jgi:probable HAF family extracellular repeat protein